MGKAAQIRRAQANDHSVLADLRRSAILALAPSVLSVEQAEQWANGRSAERFMQSIENHDLWVAEERGIAGWVEVVDDRIAALYVGPLYAQRGVGSALLLYAESAIRTAGHATVRLEASPNAVDFYLRRGYRHCGTPDAAGAYPMCKAFMMSCVAF